MPGLYVHMEAARAVVQRLLDEDVPASLAFQPGDAKAKGELAHKWRNYLAIGSIGPDMFYLLPDFKAPAGNVLLSIVKWLLDEWDFIDKLFVGSWEKWMGPVGANDSDLTNQLTGGMSSQLAQAMDEIAATEHHVILGLLTRLDDWFSLLTSGPPQGLADSAFYWSDMSHYRRTYDFPRVLWRMANEAMAAATQIETDITAAGGTPTAEQQEEIDDARADAEAQMAFALGWMTHCGTDVTGHPFTNAKAAGPYRLHWQRHHLVENHMDGAVYDMGHGGDATYEELGTAALHFRLAFRTRDDAPYNGRHDAPAYDYFAGFPAYPTGETAIDAEKRDRFFDMDPGELPEHLVDLMCRAMVEVYAPDPTVLEDAAGFNDPDVDAAGNVLGPSGRPNADALNDMWNIVFRYLRFATSDGFHPRKPMPPSFFTAAPFPTPPGGAMPAEDDGRGADPDDDTDVHGHRFNLIDFAIALLAWIKYIAQVVEWLLTVVPGLALDPATFPAREFFYYTVVAPLYSLYMASRKLLVLEGFLLPKPEEIEAGLTTLGFQTGHRRKTLSDDLNDPTGFAPSSMTFDEPSGRIGSMDEWEADPAFPRMTAIDTVQMIDQVANPLHIAFAAGGPRPSEWTMPWRYPDMNLAGTPTGWEPHRTHLGPWDRGTEATALFDRVETDLGAADTFEKASGPQATEAACHDLFPKNAHLGHPVDYGLYLIRRLTDNVAVPNFNLDSDRGYGHRCWDYDRHADNPAVPRGDLEDFHVYAPFGTARYAMMQPCTVPEQYDPAWSANDPPDPVPPSATDPNHERFVVNRYRSFVPLRIHYLDSNHDPCTDLGSTFAFPEVEPEEITDAGMAPDGSRG